MEGRSPAPQVLASMGIHNPNDGEAFRYSSSETLAGCFCDAQLRHSANPNSFHGCHCDPMCCPFALLTILLVFSAKKNHTCWYPPYPDCHEHSKPRPPVSCSSSTWVMRDDSRAPPPPAVLRPSSWFRPSFVDQLRQPRPPQAARGNCLKYHVRAPVIKEF